MPRRSGSAGALGGDPQSDPAQEPRFREGLGSQQVVNRGPQGTRPLARITRRKERGRNRAKRAIRLAKIAPFDRMGLKPKRLDDLLCRSHGFQ